MIVYHTSKQPIKKLYNSPLWCALKKSHAKGWKKSALLDGCNAHIYSIDFLDKLIHIYDPICLKLFEELKEDPNDWIANMTCNPSTKEVRKDSFNKRIIQLGYSGVIHPDYDPRDTSKDLDVLLILKFTKLPPFTKIS
jgi:hypothetical protein